MIFPQSVPDDGLNTKNDEAGPSDSNPRLNPHVQFLHKCIIGDNRFASVRMVQTSSPHITLAHFVEFVMARKYVKI